MTTNTQTNGQLPTILAALEVSIASYGDNAKILALIGADWKIVPALPTDTVEKNNYHGIAFYRTTENGDTEVIIANRGSSSPHDFLVSDALLAFNVVPDCDPDAFNYYNAVVEKVQTLVSASSSLRVIETGHSLGGHEANYVIAELIKKGIAPAQTVTVTFDAPGQSTLTAEGVTGPIDALNISLYNELVHSGGGVLNAGYLGNEITIGGGLNPIAAAVAATVAFNPALGLLGLFASGFVYNHFTDRLANYFAKAPALGGVNLSLYAPAQVTQGAADAMGKISATQYNALSDGDLASLYSSLLKGSPAASPSSDSALKETFNVESTDTGFVLHGSKGDTITATISGTQETLQDGDGNQIVLVFNDAGTRVVSASYVVADPITGTINFAQDGSSTQNMTYDSGAYVTRTDDGYGNVTTDYYSKSGVHYASDWIHSDGTSGTYEVVPNGLVGVNGTTTSDMPGTTQIVNPDGSFIVINRDASDKTITDTYKADGSFVDETIFLGSQSDYDQGAVANTIVSGGLTTYLDSHGNKLRDTWTAADGTAGTDTFHASGLTEGTKQNTDGSKDTYTVYGASAAPNTQNFVASPFATYTFLRGDDFTRTHFNADGTIASDTWQLNDGASGQDNFSNGAGTGTITHAGGSQSTLSVNATGNVTITNLDAKGNKASEDTWNSADGTHSIALFDATGVAERFTYQANGQVVDIVYAQDGSIASENTSTAGELLNPDGSRFAKVNDPAGGYDIDYWDANGDVTIFKYAGAVLQNIDHVSPSDLLAQTPAHNAYTSEYTQADGAQVTAYLDAAGKTTGSDWTKADGSHGADILNADGSKSGEQTRADGSSTFYEEDAQGNLTNVSYDANGFETSDLWRNVDGSHGYSVYNADGSFNTTDYAANGSYAAYADDGRGNSQSSDYTSAGVLLDDAWQNSDGSSGSDVHNADGSSLGSVSLADGTSAAYTNDGKNNTQQTYFDEQGTKTDDVWAHADGTHGWDNFFRNGASGGTTVNADGSWNTYTNDGRGHIVTTNYDAQGHLLSTAGAGGTGTTTALPGGGTETITVNANGASTSVIENPDGTRAIAAYQTDGTHSVASSNGLGGTATSNYDWQGNLTGTVVTQSNGGDTVSAYYDAGGTRTHETYVRADGSTGVDRISAYDLAGEQNIGPVLGPSSDYYAADWYFPDHSNAIADEVIENSTYTNGAGYVQGSLEVYSGFDPNIGNDESYIDTLNYGLYAPYSGTIYNWTGRGYVDIYDAVSRVEVEVKQAADGSVAVDAYQYANGWNKFHVADAPNASTPISAAVAGANGTSTMFSFDGQGNGELVTFDASGIKLDDIWWHNDGSMGADRYAADGSGTGISGGSNGVATSADFDAQGHITSTHTLRGFTGIPPAPPTPPVTHVPLPSIGSGSGLPSQRTPWTYGQNAANSDGHGGTYSTYQTPDGSVRYVHKDAAGRVLSDATVATDPGYSANATVGGSVFTSNWDADGRPTTRVEDDGAGTVTTQQIDAAGGVVSRTVSITDTQGNVSSRMYDTSGQLTGTGSTSSTSAGGIKTTTTTLHDAAGHPAGSTTVVTDGQGNSVTTHFDAAGAVKSSTATTVTAANAVISTDYNAQGNATFAFTSSVDVNGVVQTSTYDGAGNLTGTVVATPDAAGRINTANYDATGALTNYVVYSQDAQGDSVFDVYDAQGQHLRQNIATSTGTDTSTVFDSDGSSQSTTTATDGSYAVTTVNPEGDTLTTQFSARRVMQSDTWTRADGAHGSDTFHADGSITGMATYADGTTANIATAADGDVTTTHYAATGAQTGATETHSDGTRTTVTTFDAAGLKTGDRWIAIDGTTGTDIYAADGSRTGIVLHTDGTSDHIADDGHGNVTTQRLNADGSSTEVEVHPDGTMKTTTTNIDGTYQWVQVDALGNLLADYATSSDGSAWGQTYATDGFVTGDTWKNPDGGSYGSDTFNRDGTGTTTIFGTNGARYDYVNGTGGDTWTGTDGTHGFDEWNHADAWGTGISFNADGSYSTFGWSGEGNFTTDYTAGGKPLEEIWGRPDGSRGTISYNADSTFSGTSVDAHGVATTFDHAQETIGVAVPPQGQSIVAGSPWTFRIPTGTFRDANPGEFFRYTATLANGDALPSWLAFDAHTHTFSGTPPAGADLAVKVTATDFAGLQASSAFVISSDGKDHAPVLAHAIGNQSAVQMQPWTLALPVGTFTDADVGDTLSYSAKLVGGGALPSWLSFNAAARSFIGTPPPGSAGVWAVDVVATDAFGASAHQGFNLSISSTITGTAGNDSLNGTFGNDVLDALGGNDTLNGGFGADTLIGGAGNDTYIVDSPGDVVTEAPGAGMDTVLSSISFTLPANVENLTLTGGAGLTACGNNLANVITGNAGNDILIAGTGIATLVGGSGSTIFVVNNAADLVIEHAGSGLATIQSSVSYTVPDNVQDLVLTGTAALSAAGNYHGGTNLIVGNAGADTLVGGTGINVLEAGTGSATLSASRAAVLMGGANADTIYTNGGPAFIDAGGGADVINLGGANSVIAFNKGDGVDTITATNGTGNVLSLGGGISEGNLAFIKSGNNLVLTAGPGDGVIFKDWYAAGAVHRFATLQLIEQASSDYNAGSSNVLVNNKIEEFDFARLVSSFDHQRALFPSLSSWNLANGMLAAHLASSDTAAMGGNLAYWDGMNGNLKGMDLAAAAAAVGDPNFGQSVQVVGSWGSISHVGGNPLV